MPDTIPAYLAPVMHSLELALQEAPQTLVIQSATQEVKAQVEAALQQTLAGHTDYKMFELVPLGAEQLLDQLNRLLAERPAGGTLLLITRTHDLSQHDYQLLRNIVAQLPGLRAKLLLSLPPHTALDLQAQGTAPRYWWVVAPQTQTAAPQPGLLSFSKLSYGAVSSVVIVTVLLAWMLSGPSPKYLAPKTVASAASAPSVPSSLPPATAASAAASVPAEGASVPASAATVTSSMSAANALAAAKTLTAASAPAGASDCLFGSAPLPAVRFTKMSTPSAPSTYVFVFSYIDQKVCVADADGQTTVYALRAKRVQPLVGKAPLKVMAPDLRKMDFYVQKARVALDDKVKDRMVLTERP